MVCRVVWTRRAVADLRSVFEQIARDSRFYAQVQIERIESSAERAAQFPLIGRVVPEFPDRQWREILTGNYRVIYRHDPMQDVIKILAVVHGRRLLWEGMVSRE